MPPTDDTSTSIISQSSPVLPTDRSSEAELTTGHSGSTAQATTEAVISESINPPSPVIAPPPIEATPVAPPPTIAPHIVFVPVKPVAVVIDGHSPVTPVSTPAVRLSTASSTQASQSSPIPPKDKNTAEASLGSTAQTGPFEPFNTPQATPELHPVEASPATTTETSAPTPAPVSVSPSPVTEIVSPLPSTPPSVEPPSVSETSPSKPPPSPSPEFVPEPSSAPTAQEESFVPPQEAGLPESSTQAGSPAIEEQAGEQPPTRALNIFDLFADAIAKIRWNKARKLEKIMTELERKGTIANDDVEKLLRVSDATATRYLAELKKQGRIIQNGKTGQAVTYQKS